MIPICPMKYLCYFLSDTVGVFRLGNLNNGGGKGAACKRKKPPKKAKSITWFEDIHQ